MPFQWETYFASMFLAERRVACELLNYVANRGHIGSRTLRNQHNSAKLPSVVPEEHTSDVFKVNNIVPDAEMPSVTGAILSRLVKVLIVPPHWLHLSRQAVIQSAHAVAHANRDRLWLCLAVGVQHGLPESLGNSEIVARPAGSELSGADRRSVPIELAGIDPARDAWNASRRG
jgi:hypothetical protein